MSFIKVGGIVFFIYLKNFYCKIQRGDIGYPIHNIY